MNATDVLRHLIARGLSVTADGVNLKVEPRDLITDNMRTLIREHKPAIVAVLSVPQEKRTIAEPDIDPDLLAMLSPEDLATVQRDGIKPDDLPAFRQALDAAAARERGEVPSHYTQEATCAHCGPVWLWQGLPARVDACPWCFNRLKGLPIPRPENTAVTCGACANFRRDTVGDGTGIGDCDNAEVSSLART